MPNPTLNLSSPYENIFGTTPNYSKLKIFYCLCYPWLRLYTTHKLESRSKPCVFLGYSLTQSAYHCLNPTISKIYVSRHAQFVESLFPFTHLSQHLHRPQSITIATWFPPPIYVTSPSPLPPLNSPSAVVVPQQSPSDALLPTPLPDPLPTYCLLEPITQHTSQQPPPPNNPQATHQMTTRAKNNIHKHLHKMNLHIQLTKSNGLEPNVVTQVVITLLVVNGFLELKASLMVLLIGSRLIQS